MWRLRGVLKQSEAQLATTSRNLLHFQHRIHRS
jgi:hypothetical protein